MDLVLSAKGGNVTSWRAATDFTAAYRQALLDWVVSDHSGDAETIFSETSAALEAAIATHRKLLERLNGLIEEVASATPTTDLKGLTVAFYDDLYRHFGRFRSAPVFYQLSMGFLCRTSATIIARAASQLGPEAAPLPELSLIAVGPAGRGEYSPFCPLQILLVHGEIDSAQLQTLDIFCHNLNAGFEAAGLAVDPAVTPRNAQWRATLPEWQERCELWLQPLTGNKLIDLCRLIDQYPLTSAEGFAGELKRLSGTVLRDSRPALARLIVRMTSLSNGLGFMGRLKLEGEGKYRGMFSLLNNGLLPFSAALSALALIKESPLLGNCDRIHDLLKRNELDVEQAERMLATWHSLHSFCLQLEQSFTIGESSNRALFFSPNDLTIEQQQSLKKDLESVAAIQLRAVITFSEMGE